VVKSEIEDLRRKKGGEDMSLETTKGYPPSKERIMRSGEM
jgi:hypothetical protein